jgi:hypothetical protein
VTTGIRHNFPLQVLLVLVLGIAVAAPLLRTSPFEIQRAAAIGAALSTVNVLAGYLAIRYAYTRSYTTFLKAVLGGMGVRMTLMLGALAGLVLLGGMDAVALIVSALASYAVFLVLEIVYLQYSLSMKNQA